LQSSDILLSGFIVPIRATKEAFRRPLDGETLGDAELDVDAGETFGNGSSSKLSTPHREQRWGLSVYSRLSYNLQELCIEFFRSLLALSEHL
jgi:hypothetical protein